MVDGWLTADSVNGSAAAAAAAAVFGLIEQAISPHISAVVEHLAA